ncbi:hypothetical protein D3C73_728770 [compost metagenome]
MLKFKIIVGITAVVLIGGAVVVGILNYMGSREASEAPSKTTLISPSQIIDSKFPSSAREPIADHTPLSNPTSLTPMESYLSKIKDDKSIREQLYRLYGRLNGLVGNYDNYKTTSKDEWSKLLEYNFLKPEVYATFAQVTSSSELKKDFTSVAALVTHARKGLVDGIPSEDDITALRYAYEIVNDVQIWVLPQNGDNKKIRHNFGAFFAVLKKHKQAILIEEWIANKSK